MHVKKVTGGTYPVFWGEISIKSNHHITITEKKRNEENKEGFEDSSEAVEGLMQLTDKRAITGSRVRQSGMLFYEWWLSI